VLAGYCFGCSLGIILGDWLGRGVGVPDEPNPTGVMGGLGAFGRGGLGVGIGVAEGDDGFVTGSIGFELDDGVLGDNGLTNLKSAAKPDGMLAGGVVLGSIGLGAGDDGIVGGLTGADCCPVNSFTKLSIVVGFLVGSSIRVDTIPIL
jgi:hypothetical protein